MTLPFIGNCQKEIIDDIIAKIGGEVILLSEIEEQYALAAAQQGNVTEEARCAILDNLLSQKLIVNQAKLDSIVISEEEVEGQLDARIDRILAYMNNDVSQFEAYYGQSISEVKTEFREDLKSQLLAERMQATILGSVNITPKEVKEFFDSIPVDSLPYFNSEVEISEIIYKPKVNAVEKKKAKDKIKSLRERIVAGESFEELAVIHSDDLGSGKNGGNLGWAKRNAYVPEFEAAAYKLEKGELSSVVETEFGFHIMELIERRGNTINLRHILVKPEITEEDLVLAERVVDSISYLISIDSLNFGKAVTQYSDKNQQSFNNSGNVVNPATGNTFFEIGDLEPDVYFAIDTLEVNELTNPIAFQSQTGERLYKTVRLISRSEPHKANLKTDYSRIQKAALESKKNEYISTWVLDKVNSTYIEIDDFYEGCGMVKTKWILE